MRISTGLAVVALITLGAARLSAQAPASNDSNTVVPIPTAAAGAPMTGLRAGVHSAETPRAAHPNAAATQAHLGQARAMIVVGAAALIAGAIIGGDPGTIIMVGGAVIGLYGLYQYLQ